MTLAERVLEKLAASLPEMHYGNFDREIRSLRWEGRLLCSLNRVIGAVCRACGKQPLTCIQNNFYWKNINRFGYLYERLADEQSRERLVELLVHRLLGFSKVRLSRNTPGLWALREQVAKLRTRSAKLRPDIKGFGLYDLSPLGIDAQLWFTLNGVVVEYLLEQYAYRDIVTVAPGDVVIDCGSCWGDAAVYFARKGARIVYAFEFVPSNIELLEMNLDLNPSAKECVRLMRSAVWSESGVALAFSDAGPSTRLGTPRGSLAQTTTLAIDDLSRDWADGPVDFIKMDIEGAEVPALMGARKTIERDKPRLAVSVYHKPDDMITIPALLHSMRPDYSFYLDYYTIAGDEIVLYAI